MVSYYLKKGNSNQSKLIIVEWKCIWKTKEAEYLFLGKSSLSILVVYLETRREDG
jgi:hypothetical protein